MTSGDEVPGRGRSDATKEPRVRIVLQARTSSTRLPGKALLPLAGLPSAVVAALRARGVGELIAAIPEGPEDDHLFSVFRAAGVRVKRGAEMDVLTRFLEATDDLDDGDVVVRLTADNAFPDMYFVRELLAAFRHRGVPYLGTRSPFDDLPYGLHAEAFTAGALRNADATSSGSDREHVTTDLRRRYAHSLFRPAEAPGGLGRLRCTIDTLEDYQRIAGLFSELRDPIDVTWHELVRRLAARQDTPRFRIPFSEVDGLPHGRMVLGTAQLGMPYGLRSSEGPLDPLEAIAIIRKAVDYGVSHIDTARDYGCSEALVGEAFGGGRPGHLRVVTKLDPMRDLPADAPETWCRSAVDASVHRSLSSMKAAVIDVLLLHRARHRTSNNGAMWSRLRELQAEGWISALGISVQDPQELADALGDAAVRYVQLPFNLLDWRWREPHVRKKILSRPDVTFHVRSAFLQGRLVTADAKQWPSLDGVDPEDLITRVGRLVRELGRDSRADLALAYVRAQPWIHGIVLGVDDRAQLMYDLELFCRPALTPSECEVVEECFPASTPVGLLNPALWN